MEPMTACGYLPRDTVARRALHGLAKRIHAFTRSDTSRTTASSSQSPDKSQNERYVDGAMDRMVQLLVRKALESSY